jgi:hypothetical protein
MYEAAIPDIDLQVLLLLRSVVKAAAGARQNTACNWVVLVARENLKARASVTTIAATMWHDWYPNPELFLVNLVGTFLDVTRPSARNVARLSQMMTLVKFQLQVLHMSLASHVVTVSPQMHCFVANVVSVAMAI